MHLESTGCSAHQRWPGASVALVGVIEEQGHLLLCPRSWGSVDTYRGLSSSCPRWRLQLQANTILGMATGSGSPKRRCCRRIA